MYSRDKRSPTPKNEAVSRVMSANSAKITPLLPEEGWPRFADGVVGVPELTLRKALWRSGLRGYRLHRRIRTSYSLPARGGVAHASCDEVVGGDRVSSSGSPPYEGGVAASRGRGGSLSSVRPDISYVGKKLAIFVHGCFWHRCPKCSYKLPKTNSAFWQETVVGLPQHWRGL